MKIELNKVTWYSRLSAAIVLFGGIPALAFYIGIQYQDTMKSYDEAFALTEQSSTAPALTAGRSYQELASGVRGYLTIGPVCPVEQDPPQPQCDDRPYEMTVHIYTSAGTYVQGTNSTKEGYFAVALAPGKYYISNKDKNGVVPIYPLMTPKDFVVKADTYTELAIVLDSGIR